MCYAIVIEKATSNYAVYVPDLPGCVVTGATVKKLKRRIRRHQILNMSPHRTGRRR